MAMKMSTALQIRGNPRDLEFLILDHRNQYFSISVSRGPGHSFITLLTSAAVYTTPERIAKAVGKILEAVLEATHEEGMDDPELYLTQSWVNAIVAELKAKQKAETWKMDVPVRDFTLTMQ